MKTYLHVGCGPIHFNSTESWKWVNIDNEPSHNPDFCYDCLHLNELYYSGTIDAIYSCHHLEHMKYPDDVNKFLKLSYDLLKPRGILRLAVPDLHTAATEYLHGDARKLYGPEFKGYYYKDCPAERFMYWSREWQHTVLFDFQLLESLLKDAGFTKIRKCYPNDTEIEGFSYDRYLSESLYVEAVK